MPLIRVLAFLSLCALAIAACDRYIDLSPPPDARNDAAFIGDSPPPDAFVGGNDGKDGGGGPLPDAFVLD